MSFTQLSNPIFVQAIADYHLSDNIDTPVSNPYEEGTIENRLYLKCWIDTVQWHFEDIIRDPQIDPVEALVLKRRIDKSNQDRTDLVEQIDTYFRETRRPHQHREPGMGHRPAEHPCLENLPHARTGRTG